MEHKNKILIIGCNGFIGSHCFKYFSTNGNYITYGCDVCQNDNTRNFYLIDPSDADFESIFSSQSFDTCINCSGAANVPLSLENPFFDFELNTVNVFKILNAIKTFSPQCKFLNLSSAAVYGNPKSLPIKEEDDVNPVSPYGYHKLMAEIICEEFHKFWNLKTLSLRIFSAYGPGLKKQIFWDIFQKLKGKPESIELFGTGEETRDFIYIKDLVSLIDLVISKAIFDGSVLNAANGLQSKIKDIAKMARNEISAYSQLNFKGCNRQGDPLNWEADISKIKKIGYVPSKSLSEGIKNYMTWLKEEGLL